MIRMRRSAIPSIATLLHLHQATIERRAAAFVSEALGGERVDIAGVRRFLGPPGGGRADDARRHVAIDFSGKQAGAAIVEEADLIAGCDAPGTGVRSASSTI